MNKTYTQSVFINQQNNKLDSSNIYNIDTIRGCPNKCESCYAKKQSARTVEHFEIPVKVQEFTGKVHPERIYRIGCSGDPAWDWEYSENLIKEYGIPLFFVVTKLQKIKGYSGFFNKMQVSLDPFNKIHLQRSMENILILLEKYPDIKIVNRIRSVKTLDLNLAELQQKAVDFSNRYNLPVLETRMRFNDKKVIEKYNLDTSFYSWKGSLLLPKLGERILVGVNTLFDCDLMKEGCAGCKNCEVPFEHNRKKEVMLAQPTAQAPARSNLINSNS